jgi:paraquat-inducible protein A
VTVSLDNIPRKDWSAAFALAAAVMLIPANVLPVMKFATAGSPPNITTIFGGVALLWNEDLWGLALIVFTASVAVPALKLGGLASLLYAVRGGRRPNSRRLTRVYTIIDAIGRWSMLDVFLVAFLTGAVRFHRLASVLPMNGIIAFASVVVLTMIATQLFDPRLLWDQNEEADPKQPVLDNPIRESGEGRVTNPRRPAS